MSRKNVVNISECGLHQASVTRGAAEHSQLRHGYPDIRGRPDEATGVHRRYSDHMPTGSCGGFTSVISSLGYGVYLAEIIMNQSFELCLRQLACIMLTRYVENRWGQTEDAQNVTATDQAKKTIRNILPNGLYDPNSKIRSSVAYTISTIASWDWPDVWTELFDVIIKCLGGNEDSIHGAMQVLAEFTYEGKQMKVIRPIILSEVYRIFEAEQTYSVKTRTCAIKILKPLFSSIIYSISNKEEQTAIIDSVLPKFMEKLIYNLSVSRDTVLKTEIMKGFSLY